MEDAGPIVQAARRDRYLREPVVAGPVATWLSPADTVRMFDAGLTAPSPGFAVIYGVTLRGESFTLGTAAGLGLIVGGSWLAAEGRRRPNFKQQLQNLEHGSELGEKAWVENEIDEWIDARIKERDKARPVQTKAEANTMPEGMGA